MEIFCPGDAQIAGLLKNGAVGVLPTDTVYGLVCRAADERAVARLYSLKRRENKPGTIIAASIDQLVDLGVKSKYLTPASYLWPSSISVVVPCPELGYLHLGQKSIAVRIPKESQVTSLLKKTGPLLTSSANQSGEPPANTILEAQRYFGDLVDFYVDAGELSERQPSTIVRLAGNKMEVLRQGAVRIDKSGSIIS